MSSSHLCWGQNCSFPSRIIQPCSKRIHFTEHSFLSSTIDSLLNKADAWSHGASICRAKRGVQLKYIDRQPSNNAMKDAPIGANSVKSVMGWSSTFWLELRVQEGIHIRYCVGQKFLAREVLNPSGKYAVVVLLNGSDMPVRSLLNNSVYPRSSALFLALGRGAAGCNSQQ